MLEAGQNAKCISEVYGNCYIREIFQMLLLNKICKIMLKQFTNAIPRAFALKKFMTCCK